MKKIAVIAVNYERFDGWGTVNYYITKHLSGVYKVEKISVSGSNLRSQIRDYFRIKKSVIGSDYLICACEKLLPLAALIKIFNKRIKLILIGHGTYMYYPFVKGKRRSIYRFSLRHVDKIIVPSRFTKSKVEEHFSRVDIKVINWGVDTSFFSPVQGIKKEKAFIFVGAQKERKGIEYLFAAFQILIKDYPGVKLYMVGNSNEKYLNLANRLDLQRHIVFMGKVRHEALPEYYSRCLANILPSVNTEIAFEGYGLVHLEANACGIPSIGSTNCGNEDAIVEGTTGFLCPQRDSNCLYERMKTLIENKELWKEMCVKSLRYAQDKSWEAVTRKVIKVLESE